MCLGNAFSAINVPTRGAQRGIRTWPMEGSVVNSIDENSNMILWFELCDGWAYVFGKRTWDKLGCSSAAVDGDFLAKNWIHGRFSSLPRTNLRVVFFSFLPTSLLLLPCVVAFEQVASVGPNVKDCSKNFPRAIFCACGMQMLINGFMHFVAAGATDPAQYPQWSPGYIRWAGINGQSTIPTFPIVRLKPVRHDVLLDFMVLVFCFAYLTRGYKILGEIVARSNRLTVLRQVVFLETEYGVLC